MKLARKIYKLIVILEVVCVVIFVALVGAPRLIRIEPRIVLSGSMEPEILTGSVAYIDRNVKSEDIVVGDIIAFNIGEEQTVIHRVVTINGNESQFITKGDANAEIDFSPVSFAEYQGKVLSSIPFIGYLLMKLKDVKVMIIIALIFVSNFFIDELLEEEEETNDGQKTKESLIR